MKKLLDVENALIVEVHHLKPGNMRVDVSREGPHTVRVTGQNSGNLDIGITIQHLIYNRGTEHELLTGTAYVNYHLYPSN